MAASYLPCHPIARLDEPERRFAALVRRERKTRFAGGVFGPMWAYATPIAWIAVIVVSFNLLGRVAPLAVGAEIFVATGVLPYILFRQTITSMMRSIIAHRYLLYFRPINGNHLLAASACAELINAVISSVLIFGAIAMIFGAPSPADMLIVYIAMFLAWALGASAGALFSTIGQWSDSFARTVPLLLRPMFWLSGIFYTGTELPAPALELLAWNPLFHVIELLREGFFLGYRSPIADIWYVCTVVFGLYIFSAIVGRFVHETKRARYRI